MSDRERSLYFAYGSNLSAAAMGQRCESPHPLGAALLHDHRFVITSRGYANALPDPGRTVHGRLWDLTDADLARLDRYEGVRPGRYRRVRHPVQTSQATLEAWIYLAPETDGGEPVPGYLEDILESARALGLPAAYQHELQQWLRPAGR